MPEILLSSGTRFNADAGASILNAAAKAGISLAYSCNTGRCSTCKCKVMSGDTVALAAETGLSDAEKADGWILGCVRSATSDLVLETEELNGSLPEVKTLPCRIHSLEMLATDVLKVGLRLPPTAKFAFIPGQYVNVIGPAGIRRSYSLASAGTGENLLELHVRSVEGGAMSDYWFNQAKVNDLLRLNGPLGTFFLNKSGGINLVFLATGTGIAPVKAMLEHLDGLPAEQKPCSVTVVWGGRTERDLYLDVAALPGNHKYIPVLSRGGEDWSGARGYVQAVLLESHPNLSEAIVYACGSDAMIHSAKSALTASGLPSKNFYSDAFVCSAST